MDTRADLLRRVALAAPEARTHGNRLEIILSGLTKYFGAEVAEEVRGQVPPESPGIFNCSTVALMNLCDVAASTAELRTGRPYAEVLERLSVFSTRSFYQSSLGKGLWRMSSSDTHDVLNRTLVSLRSVYTHGQRSFERLGHHGARLVFREELMGPAWMSGVFRGAARLLPQQLQFSVENVSAPGLSFSLCFTW